MSRPDSAVSGGLIREEEISPLIGTPVTPPAPEEIPARKPGIIYEMSMDILKDGDDCPIRRESWDPVVVNEREFIQHIRVRVDLETGLVEDLDPQMILVYSDDGGKTWSQERKRSCGEIGEYSKLVDWWRLGVSRNRIYRLVMSDDYPWRIADAYLEAEPRGRRRG